MNLFLNRLPIIFLISFNLVSCLFLSQNVKAKEVSTIAVGDINLGGRVNSIIKQNGLIIGHHPHTIQKIEIYKA